VWPLRPRLPLPRLHGERIVDGLLLGEASKMASTPPSSVITVETPVAPPSVATIMTASPFCKSGECGGGAAMRLIICLQIGGATAAGLSIPAEPRPPDGGALGLVVCSATRGEPTLELGAVTMLPVEFLSASRPIRCAIGGGQLRTEIT